MHVLRARERIINNPLPMVYISGTRAVRIGTGEHKSKRADAMGAFGGIKVGPFDKFTGGRREVCNLSIERLTFLSFLRCWLHHSVLLT